MSVQRSTYACLYTGLHIHACTQVYIYTYLYTGLYIHACAHVYIYMPVHRPIYTYLRTGLYKGSKGKILEMLTNFKGWDSLYALAIWGIRTKSPGTTWQTLGCEWFSRRAMLCDAAFSKDEKCHLRERNRGNVFLLGLDFQQINQLCWKPLLPLRERTTSRSS